MTRTRRPADRQHQHGHKQNYDRQHFQTVDNTRFKISDRVGLIPDLGRRQGVIARADPSTPPDAYLSGHMCPRRQRLDVGFLCGRPSETVAGVEVGGDSDEVEFLPSIVLVSDLSCLLCP